MAVLKIQLWQEAEFAACWADLSQTTPTIARKFGVCVHTVFSTAKRLGLPPRMPQLERLKLPPFGRRTGERAA